MKFIGSIARTVSGGFTTYRERAAFIATKKGVEVFPLDGDSVWAARARSDLAALLATMKPSEVLQHLHERNSTITTYSEPTEVEADTPEQAAARLYDSER